MPANAVVKGKQIPVDISATDLVPIINGSSGAGWTCEQVRMQDGASPSWALIKIPNKELDSIAPAVAAVSGSPYESIYHGDVATISAVSGDKNITVMRGFVTSISQRWSDNEDHMIVRIEDAREIMRKWPIIGSFWAHDDSTKADSVEYRQGWKFHTNPSGAPNCIWRSMDGVDGYVPVMCAPWHGVTADTDPLPDTVESQDQACYWTADSVLQYLRFLTTPKALAIAVKAGFLPYPIWRDNLVWPMGFPGAIRAYAKKLAIGDRKADDYTYDGVTMLGAVQRVLEMSGPFSLYLNSTEELDDKGQVKKDSNGNDIIKDNMCIVRTRYDKDGVMLNRPTSGSAATEMAKTNIVLAGSLNESSANLYSRIIVGGDLVFIERRVWTLSDGTGTLRKGWDAAAETAFQAYVQTGVNARSLTLANAIQEAMRKYPQVGAAYYVSHAYDFQAGTSQADYGRATTPRPILDTLLSSYWEGLATAPTADQKRRYRRPILFEYQSAAADADRDAWYLAPVNDGLTLDADGTIWVPGLRPGYTLAASQAGVKPNAVITITYNKLCVTVAIPCDHRLTEARKLASDEGAVQPASIQSRDTSCVASDLHYTMYECKNAGDYALEERKDAWPIPESVAGSLDETDVLRDDSELLANHVERRAHDFARLERSGELIMANLLTTLRPGMQIAALDNGGAEGSEYLLGVVVRAVTLNNQNQNGNGGPGMPGQYASIEVV